MDKENQYFDEKASNKNNFKKSGDEFLSGLKNISLGSWKLIKSGLTSIYYLLDEFDRIGSQTNYLRKKTKYKSVNGIKKFVRENTIKLLLIPSTTMFMTVEIANKIDGIIKENQSSEKRKIADVQFTNLSQDGKYEIKRYVPKQDLKIDEVLSIYPDDTQLTDYHANPIQDEIIKKGQRYYLRIPIQYEN